MPSYQPKNDAPKLRKYIKKYLFNGKRVLLMKRTDWEILVAEGSGEYLINIDETPMSELVHNAEVVGCLLKQSDYDEFSLEIYRLDIEDEKPYNIDSYQIYTDFHNRYDFLDIVSYASTSNDENMKSFISDCVIIETKPKIDHHRTYDELPDKIKLQIINNKDDE